MPGGVRGAESPAQKRARQKRAAERKKQAAEKAGVSRHAFRTKYTGKAADFITWLAPKYKPTQFLNLSLKERSHLWREFGRGISVDRVSPTPAIGLPSDVELEYTENFFTQGVRRLTALKRVAARKQRVAAAPPSPAKGIPGVSGEQQQFMAALAQIESGGNYNAKNPSGAFGKYQIMPQNWPAWAKAAGLPGAQPTPENQEKVAAFKINQYFQTFKDWRLVAAAWHAGPARATQARREGIGILARYNDGYISTLDYTNRVVGQMGKAVSTSPVSPQGVGGEFVVGGTGDGAGGGAGGGELPTPLIVELSNPNDLKRVLEDRGTEVLGRTPTKQWMDEFVVMYQDLQRQYQTRAYGLAGTSGVSTLTAPPQPEIAAEQFLRKTAPVQTGAYDVVKQGEALKRILGIT